MSYLSRQVGRPWPAPSPHDQASQRFQPMAPPCGEPLFITTDLATLEQLRLTARAARRLWRRIGVAATPRAPRHDDHSRHVAQLSLTIARMLGLSADLTRRIYRAAYLHDVGSVAVAGSIAGKAGTLTPEERKAMQAHAAISGELLGALLPSADLAGIALAHHERYDGHGYPQGLGGTRIPLEARVLAIADSLDAMMSPRPYREALPFAAAWDEVIREAGRQFDPCIVEDFAAPRRGTAARF